MAKIAGLAVFAALLGQASGLKKKAAVETELAWSEWTYYPPGAKIGIVTGGPPKTYSNMNFGAQGASLMLKYAQKHGYAFYVERNLPKLGPRKKYWNKVLLMHKLLREVPTLVWIDPDIILQKLETPMETLMETAKCDGAEQNYWSKFLPKKAQNDTFLFLNSDKSPHNYPVNAHTGMVILKQSEEAFAFLSKVWTLGEDNYKRHRDGMLWLKNRTEDAGWPYEQGAFWDVLSQEPETYMTKTCIAYGTHFHSVRPYLNTKGQFAYAFYGMPDVVPRKAAQSMLESNHIHGEIH